MWLASSSDRSLLEPHPTAPAPARDVADLLPIESAAKPSITILVVDDERTLRDSCVSVLGVEASRGTAGGYGDEARELVKRRAFEIVLVDWYMREVSGMELLGATLAARPQTIVIAMTGRPSIESSLEALHAGAWDFLPKPFSGTHLQILVGRAAHSVVVARESHAMRARLHPANGDRVRLTVIGTSPPFREAVALARRVAATDASVFITGESGWGKELFARSTPQHSRRAGRSSR